MTREDMQKGVFSLRVDNLYKNHGETLEKVPVMIPYLQAKNVINSVYDNFESRTCENCIFALPLNLDKDKQYEFKCRLGHSDKLLNTVNKDFACNKFEAKDAN